MGGYAVVNNILLYTSPAIPAVPWPHEYAPARILAIRLQAIGDVAITFPYLEELQRALPDSEIDFLTREEACDMADGVALFRQVFHLGGGRSTKLQLASVMALLPKLMGRRYDVILDLQNNQVSKTVRRLLRPVAWSAFDRFSPVSAGERTRRTIEAVGLRLPRVRASVRLRSPEAGRDLLCAAGWDPGRELLVLSPAGGFPSRNWPIENYAEFARLWSDGHEAQYAVLGLPSLADRAAALEQTLGPSLLNLIGKTTASEAMAVVQKARLVVTEDCGLMHMAWTSGVPTLALFGSSPHIWSAPVGSHTRCLHSGDLPCGACFSTHCRYGDVRCLTRYSSAQIVTEADDLLHSVRDREALIFDGAIP
jgi:heptosyltransferase II